MNEEFKWRNKNIEISFIKSIVDDKEIYKVLIYDRQTKFKKEFIAKKYPKTDKISEEISNIVNFNIVEDGYKLNSSNLTSDKEERIIVKNIYYHQIEINDIFWEEYFVRLERYKYTLKLKDDDTEIIELDQYKLLIGNINTNDNGECIFFNNLTEEELKGLGDICNKFIEERM